MNDDWLLGPPDLTLAFKPSPGERRLAFARAQGIPEVWRTQCRAKLAELIGFQAPAPAAVRVAKLRDEGAVVIQALVMEVDRTLSLPGYLLSPRKGPSRGFVMAIHGHGEVGPCIGTRDDYHHAFALRLAQAGYTVLCPELRGFGALRDLAQDLEGYRLDYWAWGRHMAYSLVTDGFLYGRTLIGDTVRDLLQWEHWLASAHKMETLDVAGISYGGDLALIYPVFSDRVGRIFASGTLGSFSVIFSRCYNAPAHCIPGVLQWMDRADIAGLNAPRPLVLHYGELDTPGPKNHSASYNESVPRSLAELRVIYRAFGAEEAVRLVVSKGRQHEMDMNALLAFLSNADSDA